MAGNGSSPFIDAGDPYKMLHDEKESEPGVHRLRRDDVSI